MTRSCIPALATLAPAAPDAARAGPALAAGPDLEPPRSVLRDRPLRWRPRPAVGRA